jgi:fibronectin-binding autotransporter adhesin
VNRPTSAFVGSPAYEPANPCGFGAWSRATGGFAKASGSTTNGVLSREAELDIYYGGYQGGGDLLCFDLGNSGWEVAFGALGGFNIGRSGQDVGPNSTAGDFDQYYGGGYVAAAKGNFAIDLQARFDYINFVFDNQSFGLSNFEADSTRASLSAAATYAFQAGDYVIVPTVGASLSNVQTDSLVFNNRFTLDFKDQLPFVAFGGVTVARGFLSEDKTALYRPFATATIYSDFGTEVESVFTDPVTNASQNLSSESIGTFGELTVGLDYVKILDENQFGGRQINATIRGDAKFSDRLLSAGATVQLRLQF